MMELGATVCTPRAPQCEACPIARACRARKLGIAGELPAKRNKRATEQVNIAAGVLLDGRGRTLLVKQSGGLFSGMWQFPAVTVNGGDPRHELLARTKNFTPRARRGAAGAEKNMRVLPVARHTVTYREITLRPFLMPVPELPRIAGARVVKLRALDSLPISSATRKIARRVEQAVAAEK
jgi:A/G-specific adenine glycosylase